MTNDLLCCYCDLIINEEEAGGNQSMEARLLYSDHGNELYRADAPTKE